MHKLKITVFLFILILATSCAQRMFDFTIVSTRNIELSKLSSMERSKERVEGEDKAHLIIFIPTNTIKIDQAIDNTIASVPGCVALLDGVVYSKFWWIPYIYGQQKFIVEATPLVDPNFAMKSGSIPEYGHVYINEKGKVESIKPITKEAFAKEKEKLISNKYSKRNQEYSRN